MSEQLDTSWFDLKKYDELINLNLIGWLRQIEVRSFIDKLLHDKNSSFNCQSFEGLSSTLLERIYLDEFARADAFLTAIKKNPVIPNDPNSQDFDREWRKDILAHSFNTYSVFSTPAIFAWNTVTEERLLEVWASCEAGNRQDASLLDIKNCYTPIDTFITQSGMIDCETRTNVTIDLTVTDAQIKEEFAHWLKHYRKYSGYSSPKKKPQSDKDIVKADINEWVDFQLLAYLDLTLVAEFEKKSITGAKKIELIYPADQRLIAKPYDKLEKATDKSKWLMKESTINAIKAQIRKESRYHKYK